MTTARVAGLLLLLASALPAALARPDLAHDLQRRPGAGAPDGAASRCPRARAPSASTLGALDPASLFSLDSARHHRRPRATTARWTRPACSAARSAGGSCSACRSRRTPSARWSSAWIRSGCSFPTARVTLHARRAPRSIPATSSWPTPTATLQLESERAQDRAPAGLLHGRRRVAGELPGGARRRPSAGDRAARCVECQTLRAEDAEVQLLAGAVGRAEPAAPPPVPLRGRAAMAAAMATTRWPPPASSAWASSTSTRSPAARTLLPGLTSTIALFEPAQVKYERTYVVHGLVPWWGMLPQQGDETEAPVEIFYTLKRPRKTEFGDRPLPGGVVRLFQADSGGRAQLVGEAAMDHTPAGEDVRLSAGTAFDLTARRVQTSYVTRRDSTKAGWRTPATADYRVTVRNADRQRGHRGRAGGAGWRVERAPEQRAGREDFIHHHALPRQGAREGRSDADLSSARRLVTQRARQTPRRSSGILSQASGRRALRVSRHWQPLSLRPRAPRMP